MIKNHEEEAVHISDDAVVFWYQAILSRYTSINSANSNIDTKIGVILAATIAILIYVAQSTTQPLLLSGLAILGLITAIIISLVNIHTKNTSTETHTTEEMGEYYHKTDTVFYWQMIADLEDSLKNIEELNKKKAKLYGWAVYLVLASSLLFILAHYIRLTFYFGWV